MEDQIASLKEAVEAYKVSCQIYKEVAEKALEKTKLVDIVTQWRLDLIKAVQAQAKDETLWFFDTLVSQDYLQQSLRWLHQLIEKNDPEALQNILNQSEGKI